MDRREYIQALDRALHPLASRREREDILRYYEEYFDEAGPEKEEAVIALLGDPEELARGTAQVSKPYPLPELDLPDPDDPAARSLSPRKLARWIKKRKRLLAAAGACLMILAALTAFLRPRGDGLPRDFPPMEPLIPDNINVAITTAPIHLEVSFTSIRVETDVANVRVKKGDTSGIALQWLYGPVLGYNLSYGVEDGVLYIAGGAPEETIDVNTLDAWVEIIVPRDTILEQVAINTGIGNIEISGVSFQTLAAHTGNGSVSLRASGQAAESISLSTDLGNVYQSGPAAGELRVKTGTGDIFLRPACARRSCSYELNAGGNTKTVWINGVSQGNHAAGQKPDNQVPDVIIASTGKGNISLDFAT